MNLKHVWIVFRKEVKDIARDKKTLITNLVVPIVLFPVLFALIGGGVKNLEKSITENVVVALSEKSDTPEIRAFVKEKLLSLNPNIILAEDVEDPIQAVRDEKVRLLLELDEDYLEKLEKKEPFTIRVLYDKSKMKSSESVGMIQQIGSAFKQSVVKERLVQAGIDPQVLEPSVVEHVDVSEKEGGGFGNMMLMMMIPMLVAILIAVGGIPAATDLVAGEKERFTFEPLLTTKPGRMSILLGKYFTVTLFSLFSVVAQFIGMMLGLTLNPGSFAMGSPDASLLSFEIPPVALALVLLITLALGMVFAGIQLMVSTYAKSFKEAQTYMSFLIFAAMIPAYATMMMQPGDIKTYMFAVPLLNAIAALKTILGGIIDYTNLLLALCTSVIYVAVSLYLTAKLFNKEKVLFRS